MTKEEFNLLDILEQVEYINKLHAKGTSLNNISLNLGFGRATIRTKFTKGGYSYNKELKRYCKDRPLDAQLHQVIKKVPYEARERVTEPVDKESTKELQKYDNKDILELINKKTEILDMLEYYKRNTKVIDIPQLNISSLPQEMQTKIINKSIKVYEQVYKSFDNVCSRFSGIKKQDIISLALYEFCDKYKK